MDNWVVDLLTLLFAGLAVAIPVLGSLWRLRTTKWPFRLRFSEQPIELPASEELDRRFLREWNLIVNKPTTMVVALSTLVPAVTGFDIRFVCHDWSRFGSWRNVGPEVAEVLNVRIPRWELEAVSERDFVGVNKILIEKKNHGFAIFKRAPQSWVVGQFQWIEVTAVGHKPGCIWLSVEGRTDRRAFARGPVTIR